MLGDIGSRETRRHRTGRRGDFHGVAPVAEAVGAAIADHMHLVGGAGEQIGECVGRQDVLNCLPCAAAEETVLQVVALALAGPGQGGGVVGDTLHREVVGGLAADQGEDVRLVAPVAPHSAAVGANHHSVFRLSGQVIEDIRIAINIDDVPFIEVDHDLPFGGCAVLRPAQLGGVLGDVGGFEVRGSGTSRRGIANHEQAGELTTVATTYTTEGIGFRCCSIYQIDRMAITSVIMRPEELASLHVKGHSLYVVAAIPCGSDKGGGSIG